VARVAKGRIEPAGEISFTKTTLAPDAFPLLDSVARALKAHAEIEQLRIEARTAGSDLELSQRRAEAVREYLIARGIDPGLLVARGLGGGEADRVDFVFE
jgi:OmpA-OmpF porin, OOP family